jgi:hypothetical protein
MAIGECHNACSTTIPFSVISEKQCVDHSVDQSISCPVPPNLTGARGFYTTVSAAVLGFATIVLLLFATMNWVYVEAFTRKEITVRIEGRSWLEPCSGGGAQVARSSHGHQDPGPYRSCASVNTDQGNFRFPQKSRRFGNLRVSLWNDTGEISWAKLTNGCTYRVIMTGAGLFLEHKLGVFRAPVLNTIVKVVERVEKSDAECGYSK